MRRYPSRIVPASSSLRRILHTVRRDTQETIARSSWEIGTLTSMLPDAMPFTEDNVSSFERLRVTTPEGDRELLQMHYDGYRIWGATATILYHLAQQIAAH